MYPIYSNRNTHAHSLCRASLVGNRHVLPAYDNWYEPHVCHLCFIYYRGTRDMSGFHKDFYIKFKEGWGLRSWFFAYTYRYIFCVCCIALLCTNHRVVVRWNTLNWIYRPRIFLTHKKQPLKNPYTFPGIRQSYLLYSETLFRKEPLAHRRLYQGGTFHFAETEHPNLKTKKIRSYIKAWVMWKII